MADPNRPRIRWLTNVFLNVKNSKGKVKETLFPSGSYTNIKKIIREPDGYGDIYIAGDKEEVIEGVQLEEGFELHGRIRIEEVESSSTKDVPADTNSDNASAPPTETERNPPLANEREGGNIVVE